MRFPAACGHVLDFEQAALFIAGHAHGSSRKARQRRQLSHDVFIDSGNQTGVAVRRVQADDFFEVMPALAGVAEGGEPGVFHQQGVAGALRGDAAHSEHGRAVLGIGGQALLFQAFRGIESVVELGFLARRHGDPLGAHQRTLSID